MARGQVIEAPARDGAGHLPARPIATAARAGALLVGAAVSAGLAVAFARRALEARTVLTGPWDGAGAWTTPGGLRVEDLVGLGAVVVGSGVAAWFGLGLLVAATCTGVRAAGHAWVAGERLVGRAAPRLVRRALVLAAGSGVALAGAGLPALAVDAPPDQLGWAVTTDVAPVPGPSPDATAREPAGAATVAVPVAGSTPPAAATGGAAAVASPEPVTVRPGDTLWDIARHHLPPGATTADVAASWPDWYGANIAVVGSDPDLIHPGQRLVAPAATGDAPAPGVTSAGPAGGSAADGADR